MIFNYKGHNYCVNCDWLSFNARLQDVDNLDMTCPDGVRIELCQGNNIFAQRALIYGTDGTKLLTLLWQPYSKVISKDIMTVQVANEVLYKSGIQYCITLLHQIVDCYVNTTSRIDIALDFEADTGCLTTINQLWISNYYVSRKREGSTWWHSTTDDTSNFNNFCHCLSWGSKTSKIKVKLYNKSRELDVKDNVSPTKQYIVDEWRQAGMDVDNIWRLEFSLTSTGVLIVDNKTITIDDVCSTDWLLNLYLNLYHNRFDIRVNEGKRQGHHNDDERVYLLDLPTSTTTINWIVGDTEKTLSEPIKLLRKTLTMLESDLCRCNTAVFDSVANVVYTLIQDKAVRSYMINLTNSLPDVYLDNLRDSAGAGMMERIAEPSKQWL